jgi:F0F1-type ATP synthase membrane subunit b/b'
MMIADAHTKIEEDIEKARKGLETEMRGLVAEATEAIIRTKLDPKADAELLGKTMKELS